MAQNADDKKDKDNIQAYLEGLSNYDQRRIGLVFLGLHWAKEKGHKGHLKAGELVTAIADGAEDRWGVMAPVVLEHLQAGTSQQIGAIVTELLETGLINADAQDKASDFDTGPDLTTRFAIERYPWKVPDDLAAAKRNARAA